MSAAPSPIAAIGGVFLYSQQPAELAAWYSEHLGLEFEHAPDHGAHFARFDYTESGGAARYALFAVLAAEQRPPTPEKLFTVNLRVHDLAALVSRLRAGGAEVTDTETHPEGRFAWVHDPDGNRLELWEDTAG